MGCNKNVVKIKDIVKVLQDLGWAEAEAQKLVKEVLAVKDFSLQSQNATSDTECSIRKLHEVVKIALRKNRYGKEAAALRKQKAKPRQEAGDAEQHAPRTDDAVARNGPRRRGNTKESP